jgi:putative DNA primase/helicase
VLLRRERRCWCAVSADLTRHIDAIARRILGEPNKNLSTRSQLRFGSNGSIAVEITGKGAGEWYDHEERVGGGPWKFLRLKGGLADADIPAWLECELGIAQANGHDRSSSKQHIVKTYDYHDERGALLFQVVRMGPKKTFFQRAPDGKGGWRRDKDGELTMQGVRTAPYRLPDLSDARTNGNGHPWRVFIVEGEKDADRLRTDWGLTATTNPGGAGKWRGEYNLYFAGADVVIIPDNDEAGRKHAHHVAANLAPVAASVRILELQGLPEKGDVSDWIEDGGTQSDLETLVELASTFQPDEPGNAELRRVWGKAASESALDRGDVLIRSGEELTMKKIEWLWPGWLARGKFHMLAGKKGAGKSTILFDLMARLTAGVDWPDGKPASPGDVMVWSGEDGIEDTILPRFYAAGGVRSRIFFPTTTRIDGAERPFDPSTDIGPLINAAARLPNLLLVMIDPVVLALPVRSDSHKNTETRRGLQPLVDFAEQRGIALMGLTHFTKGTEDRDPVERVTGSLAFGALPRCVWGASADDDGRQRRLVRIASNIGPQGGGIEYTLFQALLPDCDFFAQRVDWGAQLKGSARELLNASKRSAEAEAAAFLATFLSDGPKPQREVKDAADAHCHSWATIRRAQEKLGIEPQKTGKFWCWALPARVNAINPC